MIYHRSEDCIVGADVQESVLNCRGQNVFSVKTQLQHTFSTLLGRNRSFSRKLNNLNLDPSMRSCDGLKNKFSQLLVVRLPLMFLNSEMASEKKKTDNRTWRLSVIVKDTPRGVGGLNEVLYGEVLPGGPTP